MDDRECIKVLQDQIIEAVQRLNATRLVVGCLVATHHNPDDLRRRLRSGLAAHLDGARNLGFDLGLSPEQAQQGTAVFQTEIDVMLSLLPS